MTADSVENSAFFGTGVATGDFDGDGAADVVGGEPKATPGGSLVGECTLWWGPGFSTREAIRDPRPAHGQRFGTFLATADVNDDSIREVLIASPEKDVNGNSDGAVLHCDYSGRRPFVRYSHGQAGSSGVPDLFGTGSGKANTAGTIDITNGPANEMGRAADREWSPTTTSCNAAGRRVLGVFTHALGFMTDGTGIAQFQFTYPPAFSCDLFYLEAFVFDGPTHICHTKRVADDPHPLTPGPVLDER